MWSKGSDMKRRWLKWKWLLALAATLVVATLIAYRPIFISYHRAAVRDARRASPPTEPASWREYFSMDYLRWRVMGRPTFEELRTKGREHEDALIRMGYFERRTYYPSNFSHQVVLKIRTNAIKDELIFFSRNLEGAVEVIAHKDDFVLIEEVMTNAASDTASPFE
jgi:hypothetical protein